VIADLIGGIFWFGILATPLISFLIVRKFKSITKTEKFIAGIIITVFLAVVFYHIAISIIFKDGMGPG